MAAYNCTLFSSPLGLKVEWHCAHLLAPESDNGSMTHNLGNVSLLRNNNELDCILKRRFQTLHSTNSRSSIVLRCFAERATRTPHSGYHFDGSSRRFMEGWYFKVSIPNEKQSFAWMYSVEDPGTSKSHGKFEEVLRGPRFPGVGAQVLGADDEYLWQNDDSVKRFWGSRHELELGHTFEPKSGALAPNSKLDVQDFSKTVEEGFQVTPILHQGFLRDNGRSVNVQTVGSVRWEYTTYPVYGWGNVGAEQKATAGWLAALPVFEPHWQICMAGGLATGWIEWGDRKFEFVNAPSYSEKNWGGSFPDKWFWVQCNVFEGGLGEIALTAGGGRRGLPFMLGAREEVAMVGVHYDGQFYEFVPWEGTVEWEIAPWGDWKMSAQTKLYEVKLQAETKSPGTVLRAPTADAGLVPFCRDTFNGSLRLQLWKRTQNGALGQVILDVTSDMAALETGGGPWYSTWKKTKRIEDPIRTVMGLHVNVNELFRNAPNLKPPGL
ncbi:hypothetical protein O6H91_20G009500 [Diphasiastrum complanatum]|uniref:Uncharacterized protein n=2 Tax=Diphasiastrum complanatum TaxID=34168 RepID=A0ACC2APD6_DIPCM|nr:hypothetical protein O6H91_20G009500 [Diphasiastrum complanatum]